MLQQAYEKAIKALGIALLSPKQLKDKPFTAGLHLYLLHHHTPMTAFTKDDRSEMRAKLHAAIGADADRVLKELITLRNLIQSTLQDDTDVSTSAAWTRIDGTRPTKSVDAVSFRYPFIDTGHPEGIAPTDWDGWDAHQGTLQDVNDAITELISRVATLRRPPDA